MISVIVPNYNHKPYLKDRLESIFNQGYQDYEVILLDDCSTDDSEKLLLEYTKHPKVSICEINKSNFGSPFRQWKKGIDLAKGDYIWIAESDDFCQASFLETLIKPFSNPKVVLVYCQSKIIDGQGNIVSHDNLKWTNDIDSFRWSADYTSSGIDECAEYLSIKNTIPNASAVLFKKDIMDKIEWDIDKFKMTGDWMLWVKLLMNGDVAYVSDPLNYFRNSPNNTRIHNTKRKKIVRIWEELVIMRFLKKNNLIPKNEYKSRSRMLYRNAYYSLLK